MKLWALVHSTSFQTTEASKLSLLPSSVVVVEHLKIEFLAMTGFRDFSMFSLTKKWQRILRIRFTIVTHIRFNLNFAGSTLTARLS